MVPLAAFGIVNSGMPAAKNSLHNLDRKVKMNSSTLLAGNSRRLGSSIQYVIYLPVIKLPEPDIQTP
jgi:hypothetical protein